LAWQSCGQFSSIIAGIKLRQFQAFKEIASAPEINIFFPTRSPSLSLVVFSMAFWKGKTQDETHTRLSACRPFKASWIRLDVDRNFSKGHGNGSTAIQFPTLASDDCSYSPGSAEILDEAYTYRETRILLSWNG